MDELTRAIDGLEVDDKMARRRTKQKSQRQETREQPAAARPTPAAVALPGRHLDPKAPPIPSGSRSWRDVSPAGRTHPMVTRSQSGMERWRGSKRGQSTGARTYMSLVKRPKPSAAYISGSSEPSKLLDQRRPLLVILDLNGTLILKRNTRIVSRHDVTEFLKYVSTHHRIMVWSSAQPANVEKRTNDLFTNAGLPPPRFVWDRTHLRLSDHAYRERSQVYKQLDWVWNDVDLQAAAKAAHDVPWDHTNTVLIDDSTEKAASEPYNVIAMSEFTWETKETEKDVLGQVARYLEVVSQQSNVSSYIKDNPFTPDPEAVSFDWQAPGLQAYDATLFAKHPWGQKYHILDKEKGEKLPAAVD